MGARIQNISGLEILDSRGNPTIETTVLLDDGSEATASVPSGASTGSFEAHELRDRDMERYEGKGVLTAVHNVDAELNDLLRGRDVTEQRAIDEAMIQLDGTSKKARLGANAIVSVSLAAARAAATAEGLSLFRYLRKLYGGASDFVLPVPLVNVINGGKHADNNLDFQEFWIVPHGTPRFDVRLKQANEIFDSLGAILKARGLRTDLGDEGGYAPDLVRHEDALDLLVEAIEDAGYAPGSSVALGLDLGASVFFNSKSETYDLSMDGKKYTSDEFIAFLMQLIKRYPIRAIEDPLAEEEWAAWTRLTERMRRECRGTALIGDDLFTTNVGRLQKGITGGAATAILIKPNQIGTLTETLDCVRLAREHDYAVAISHRSGETNDSFIADLAVAVNADFIKTGSTARAERVVKYNRLLTIEHELEQS